MLYQHNIGIRDYVSYTDAMLNNSLFYYYMREHGLQVYNEESTRDVICLRFDFGSKSYKEQRKRVEKLFEKAKSDEERASIQRILDKVDENKEKYVALTREQIRTKFYEEGVDVVYEYRDSEGNIEYADKIHYVMLFRTPAKAKVGEVMFIREELYETAHNWLTMGIKLPEKGAKIVEMSAYAPLTTSTIVGLLSIPVENILILKDQDSFFKTVAEVVKAEDYVKPNGETAKKCVVQHEETQVKNTLWDGMALIDTDSLPLWVNGMCLLRNHMFKACAFRTRIQKFFRDWCEKTGNDYETYEVQDMFGYSHRLKDIQMITTDNSIKWKKFLSQMGGTLTAAYDYWCEKIRADGCKWGIVKTDHTSKLGRYQQMSYQMVNTLPLNKDEIGEVARTSIEYVEELKRNPDKFEEFLRENANEINHYEMMADLYRHNPEIANSRWFRREKRGIINQYVFRLRNGKIFVEGDNLTVCGNPYALLLYSVGEDWQKDPTLRPRSGVIECYTPRFQDGEYLLGIRNPHNSPNNLGYFLNIKHELMEKYFEFSSNIMAVNCIETDIQSRMNGEDFDSDFNFVSNHPTLVKAAKICYEKYPTIVNSLKESGLVYNNTMADYARMDNMMAHSQLGIGWSSNAAQLCMSYFWTELAKQDPNKQDMQSYYQYFIILSVLAQIIIDGCKRVYEIEDGLEEIKRILREPCMVKEIQYRDNSGKVHTQKKDFPLFMKYTRDVPHTKNGEELPYEIVKEGKNKLKNRISNEFVCPMNWLQDHLNKIQGMTRQPGIPTEQFFIKMKGHTNRHMSQKILRIIRIYSDTLRRQLMGGVDSPEEMVAEIVRTMGKVTKQLREIRIKNPVTINRLIETALDLDGSTNKVNKVYQRNNVKYSRQILNCLYRMDKDLFLSNFVKGNSQHRT